MLTLGTSEYDLPLIEIKPCPFASLSDTILFNNDMVSFCALPKNQG